jgi:coenzyme F420-reducing hydrogenase gamma subunit
MGRAERRRTDDGAEIDFLFQENARLLIVKMARYERENEQKALPALPCMKINYGLRCLGFVNCIATPSALFRSCIGPALMEEDQTTLH